MIQPVDVHLTEHKKQVRLPPCCLYPAEDFLGNSDFPPLYWDRCWDTLKREIRVQSPISITCEKPKTCISDAKKTKDSFLTV